MAHRIVPCVLLLSAAACALIQSPSERVESLADASGFRAFSLPDVPIRAYVRAPFKVASESERLTLYIEGDGAPWPAIGQAPRDPTPTVPLVMHMAIADPSRVVAYVGRPCQYALPDDLPGCNPALWTHGRYGETAVRLLGRMVDRLREVSGANKIALVGYSGGGAIAALLAARRDDVTCLVTVASPLDTRRWTAATGMSPLRTSLNPADEAAAFGNKLRQTHFSGLRDTVVPRDTISSYLVQSPGSRVIERADFDHDCCWSQKWTELRQQSCLADS